jgi:hypothetical protein
MAYTAEISRNNSTGFLFLIDQSGSMAGPFGGDPNRTKAQGVADAINRLLETLVTRCSKGDDIADRYLVGIIGATAEGQKRRGSIFRPRTSFFEVARADRMVESRSSERGANCARRESPFRGYAVA